MKKKMLAFALSLALAFSGMTLLGATDGSERAAAAIRQLPAPVNVRMTGYYNAMCELPTLDSDERKAAQAISWRLFKEDGTCLQDWLCGLEVEDCYRFNNIAPLLTESGKYYVETYIWSIRPVTNFVDSEEVCIEFTYQKPSKALGTTVAKWSDIGKVTLAAAVEGADDYVVYLYEYEEEKDVWRVICNDTMGRQEGAEVNYYGVVRIPGLYRVRVRALSSNIDEIAHGELGDWSEILDTTKMIFPTVSGGDVSVGGENNQQTSKDEQGVSNSIDAAIAANPGDAAAAVEALKADQDIKNIQTAMQTNSTVLDKVKALEDSYKNQQGVEVLPTAVSALAAQYVNAAISVVGAAFNAAQNTSIGLQVSVPAKPVPVSTRYINNVQLEIKLVNAGQSKVQLDMPVTITMPIPAGLNSAQLVILHNHVDGSVEKIYPRVSGGYVTFTVTSFSTFVFANEAETTSDNGDGSGSSGGSGNWTGDVIDSIKSAQDGAVVKISGVTTLTADMLRALRDKKNVSLQLEFTYQGVDHTVLIPAGRVVLRDDVYYYGPMFLLSLYGEMAPGSVAGGNVYIVKPGDTLSKIARANGMTTAQLAAKNQQIKNIDMIHPGQSIQLR